MTAAPDIFLSCNRKDLAPARRFAEVSGAAGLSVWSDVTLRSGEACDKVTGDALRGARAVVVLWSPRPVASCRVRAEASIADENGTLVPTQIEACQRSRIGSGWQAALGDPLPSNLWMIKSP
jgi:hypothetical protein